MNGTPANPSTARMVDRPERQVRNWRERLPAWIETARKRPVPWALGTLCLIATIAGLCFWVWAGDSLVPAQQVPEQKLRIINSKAPPPVPLPDLKPVAAEDAREINRKMPFATLHPVAAKPFRFLGDTNNLARAVDCLAAAAWYEAGNDAQWQKAVIQTVINRARHPAFPATICGTVFQGSDRKTGCQFTFTCDGTLAVESRRPPAAAWKKAQGLAAAYLSGTVDPAIGYATHYHADYVVPYWADSLDKIAMVGPHIFYRWPGFWGTPAAFRQAVGGAEPSIPALARMSPAHAAATTETALPEASESPAAAIAPTAPPLHPGSIPAVADSALRGNTVRDASEDGTTMFLKLDPQSFPGAFAMTSLALCKGKRTCRVLGWKEDAALGRTFPLGADNLRALSFAYVKDMKRGIERSYWNCTQYSRADSSQCLPVEMTARQKALSPE